MRYFIHLSYDGANYHGWQEQPNGISVQEVLQHSLSVLVGKETKVVGAGRTDAGVNALVMVAHFDVEEDVPPLDCERMVHRLNRLLPGDMVINHIKPVSNETHARYSAVRRTYHYFVHQGKQPFRRHYSWQLLGEVNFQRMNEAAALMLGQQDFTSFSKVKTDTKTNICTVEDAKWEELEPGVWRFSITANRFLRNMVRAVVGTLLDVGRGNMTVEQFANVIEAKDRCRAGASVPGHPLFLVDIQYSSEEAEEKEKEEAEEEEEV